MNGSPLTIGQAMCITRMGWAGCGIIRITLAGYYTTVAQCVDAVALHPLYFIRVLFGITVVPARVGNRTRRNPLKPASCLTEQALWV